MKKLVIAIDGPAGAGKSTIAKIIADKLGILYIDTGAMYRAVTLSAIKNNISTDDVNKICALMDNINIDLQGNKVYLNGEDVTENIRSQQVSELVSKVSAMPYVREKLVKTQRDMASNSSVIMDGRDIGTNVLKDADIKIFLTASIEERAKRRYIEMLNKGYSVDYKSIEADIANRDRIDSERKVNPLRKADDAIIVDTTGKSIDTVVNEILNIVWERWDDAL